MAKPLRLELDRSAKTPLAEQIRKGIRAAIESGVLAPGARLPSWRDLAAQLGVARGTVRAAYERLADALLVVPSGPAGTLVAEPPVAAAPAAVEVGPFVERRRRFASAARPFQMGVPGADAFPARLWARTLIRAVRAEAEAPMRYPDPAGAPELREQIAGYLAIARGLHCAPEQILITRCYRDGLRLAIRTLGVE